MIKDIEFNKVKGIGMAIVKGESDDGVALLESYLLNFKDVDLHQIMIRSKGQGMVDQKKISTSTLRMLIERVESKGFVKIDSFSPEAATLSNEYWISFREDNYLYDKKFIFVRGSITDEHFVQIPFLNQKGVLIR